MSIGVRVAVRDVLAVRAVALLWAVEAQSTLGDQLARVAVTILVYDQTGSAVWSGIVLALTYIPDIVGTLGLSWLADRYPRWLVMSGSAVVQAVLFAMMSLLGGPPWLLGIAIAVSTVALAPYRAAGQALLYEVVATADERLAAQNVIALTRTVGQIGGLAMGGAVVTAIGPRAALMINAATFCVAVAVLVNRRLRVSAHAAARTSGVTLAREAMVHIRRDGRLLSCVGLMCLAGITSVPDAVVAPLAAQLQQTPAAVGVLLAAHPAGMAVYMLLIRPGAQVAARLVPMLVWLSLLPLAAFALLFLAPYVSLAVVLLVVSGIGLAYHPVLQHEFADTVPGRVRASAISYARMALRLAQGVGIVVGGAIAEWTGSPVAVVTGAGVLGCGLAAWGLRARRRAFAEARPH